MPDPVQFREPIRRICVKLAAANSRETEWKDGWSFEEGEAVIKLVDNGDKVALLVAGTSADDTRRAATALANYGSYDLSGTEVMVSGTSDTDITIGAVEEAAAEEEVAEEETAEEETTTEE